MGIPGLSEFVWLSLVLGFDLSSVTHQDLRNKSFPLPRGDAVALFEGGGELLGGSEAAGLGAFPDAEAIVEVSEPMGAETYLYLDTGGHSFIAKVESGDRYEMQQKVKLHFDMNKAHFFDPESELVLRK